MPARSRPTTFCSKTVSSDCGAPLDAATKVPQKRYSRRSGDERSPSAVRLAGFHVGPIAALPVPVEPDERFFDFAFGQFLGHRLVVDFADVLDAATRVAGADGVEARQRGARLLRDRQVQAAGEHEVAGAGRFEGQQEVVVEPGANDDVVAVELAPAVERREHHPFARAAGVFLVDGGDDVALAAAACAAGPGAAAEDRGRDDQGEYGDELPGGDFHCWILLILRPMVEPTDWMSRFQVPAGSTGATVARSRARVVPGGLSPAITGAGLPAAAPTRLRHGHRRTSGSESTRRRRRSRYPEWDSSALPGAVSAGVLPA